MRHPCTSERYLLSWSRSPELVERADTTEFTLVVRMSVYVPRNARALMAAMRLGGEVKGLSHGEIAARAAGYKPYSVETWRAWEYWANRAGCGHLVGERPVEEARTLNQACSQGHGLQRTCKIPILDAASGYVTTADRHPCSR